MADDFGDFADFSSAYPPTTSTTTSNDTQGKVDGGQGLTDNFFASFPSTGEPPTDINFSFGFDGQLEGISSEEGFANFDVTNTNIADIHIPTLDLPSPPGSDVHLAGGVPFDIPPIPLSPSEDDATNGFQSWPQPNTNGSQMVGHHTDKKPAAPIDSELNLKSALTGGGNSTNTSGFGTNDAQSSSAHISGGAQDDNEFGEFESSLTFTTTKTTANSSDNAHIESTSAGELQLPSSDDASKSKDDSFGSFVGDSNSRTQTDKTLDFGSFESGTALSLDNKVKEKKDKSDISQFADFGAFEKSTELPSENKAAGSDFGNFEAFGNTGDKKESVSQKSSEQTKENGASNSDFGNFEAFSNGPKKETNSQLADFGDFSAFEQSSAPSTKEEKSTFGDFEAFSSKTESTTELETRHTGQAGQTTTLDSDFANFESAAPPSSSAGGGSDFSADFSAFQSTSNNTALTASDHFANFGSFTGQTTTSHSDAEFGDFSGAGGSNNTTTTTSKDDFGDFSAGDDDFGNFSSSTSGFGDFSSTPAAPAVAQPSTSGTVKIEANAVLTGCFSGSSQQQVQNVLANTSLFQRLLKDQQSTDKQEVWQVLQKCIDFTVPLHKWDSSYMQENYYEALKIDPHLVSKPSSALSLLTSGMAQFEAPLGGVTAAEDLIESFGFQGDLEVSPTERRQFRLGSPGAPALLDLSLPATPTSPTNKDSFTLAQDLLGLDLNPQQQSQQLSSVEELVRNERLVVSQSTWVDSKLLELGGGSLATTEATTSNSGNNSQPSTPRSTNKQNNSVELQLMQLGLDVSKTTFGGGSSNGELSLSARSVLGRLPDLSFMLSRDDIVHSTYYSRSK